MKKSFLRVLLIVALGLRLAAQDAEIGKSKLPPPAHANVAYGPHTRHVLDVWLADSTRPTPVLIYFHGGGFVAGSKGNLPASVLAAALRDGISVVAVNYRFAPEVAFPAHYLDCARAIQFVRHSARTWNLDPTRVALTGSSAGAGTALWIAFHDDLADPASADPVARESTRVTCLAVMGAQPTYDRRVIREVAGEAAAKHPVFANLHGLKADELETEKAFKLYAQAAALTYLTRDDPPVFAYYSEPRTAVAPDARAGTGIHHPNLGLLLKSRMETLGLECVFLHRDQKINVTTAEFEFLRRHLFPAPVAPN
ncbi:alpha/beta hydrolase [Oleiharenicola lentus]|uniref:alpha/beta hydrolase n=1 Tax=Oleiharenicola lentus TaxID=2508720 RepID=UPI003F67D52D